MVDLDEIKMNILSCVRGQDYDAVQVHLNELFFEIRRLREENKILKETIELFQSNREIDERPF